MNDKFVVIHLKATDTLPQLLQQIDQNQGSKVILVVMDGDGLTDIRLNLTLLLRQAAGLNIDLALVTTDPTITIDARRLGVPVFPSVSMAQSKRWSWPWLTASPPQDPAPFKQVDAANLREVHRRTRPTPWYMTKVERLAGLVIMVFVLTAVLLAVAITVPHAQVTLYPKETVYSVTTMATADTKVKKANVEQALIPARVIRVKVSWRGASATSGATDVSDARATGTVIFINQQTLPVTVFKGTTIRTSAGITVRFQTTEEIQVPGALGATAEAPIVALEPGPLGNVRENLINQIEGALALQLNVRNLSPTAGGSVRSERAVTQNDIDRLREQVSKQLIQLSKGKIGEWMSESEVLVDDTLTIFSILSETSNRYIGERADSVEFSMSALVEGIVVDTEMVPDIVYADLKQNVPVDHVMREETVLVAQQVEIVEITPNGEIIISSVGQASAAPDLNPEFLRQTISGQPLDEARIWLDQNVSIRQPTEIRLNPEWFPRVPIMPVRISVDTVLP